jgi:sugar O-acyltransferase (sialic acid O-acetyltransferase NeuD family)
VAMKKLVIYGIGLIAEVAEFYFRTDSDYEVSAFTNAAEFIADGSFQGKPLVPFEDIERSYSASEFEIFIALGYAKTNKIRQARYEEAKRKGYACAKYISSRAAYYGTPVGENCFILEQNVIQPMVTIGRNVTLWSGNHIGHHSTVGDHCFISSHVVVSGGCDIGENCFLGVNSTLRDNVKLGRFSVVGSGAVVMKDCDERTVVKSPEAETVIIKRDVI